MKETHLRIVRGAVPETYCSSFILHMNAGTWIIMYEGLAAKPGASFGSLRNLFNQIFKRASFFLLGPNMLPSPK